MKTTTKLNNIQVLRAFAAVVVVQYHTGFAFPFLHSFGSFGVDVFFIISGYIMARILDPESDSNSDFFLRRRILRIVPPYWFFTLLLFVAALKVPQLMGATRATGVDLLKSLFFIPYAKVNGVIQPLLFIGWSLNYEMFFYVALSAGVLIHKRMATWIGAAIVLVTMLACSPFTQTSLLARFYARDIILEFLLGILSYYVCRAVSDRTARRLRPLSLAFFIGNMLLLIGAQALLGEASLYSVSRVITLGIPALLLVTSASLLSQGGWDTNLKWLVLIGDASYILYLIHPYCEYTLDRVFSPHLHWLKRETATGALIGVTLSIALALVVHVYGERPLVRMLSRKFGGRRKPTEFPASAVI